MVARLEFVGQDVRADQGERRTVAGEWRTAVPGVADQSDAPLRPFRYDDAAGAVEVEVLRIRESVEQVLRVPAETVEPLQQQRLLRSHIPIVVVDDRRAETEQCLREARIAVGPQSDPAAAGRG